MTHTFLFAEGVWRAKGTYYDGDNNCVSVEGETKIIHTPSKWINEGFMCVKCKIPLSLRIDMKSSILKIRPISLDGNLTTQI